MLCLVNFFFRIRYEMKIVIFIGLFFIVELKKKLYFFLIYDISNCYSCYF